MPEIIIKYRYKDKDKECSAEIAMESKRKTIGHVFVFYYFLISLINVFAILQNTGMHTNNVENREEGRCGRRSLI